MSVGNSVPTIITTVNWSLIANTVRSKLEIVSNDIPVQIMI